MLLCIFLVYLLAIWIIFYKFKVAVLDFKAKVIIFAIGVGIVAVVFFMAQRYAPYTKDVYVQTFVIEMAPEVSGRVTEVLAEEGVPVAAGSLLFRIDDRLFRYQVQQLEAQLIEAQQEAFGQFAALDAAGQAVKQAESAVTVAEKSLLALQAAETAAQAAVDKSNAQFAVSLANYQRGKQIEDTDAITPEELEELLGRARIDRAAVVQAKQGLSQAEAEVASGSAQLAAAQAALLASFANQRQVQAVVEPLATIDEIIAENQQRIEAARKQLNSLNTPPQERPPQALDDTDATDHEADAADNLSTAGSNGGNIDSPARNIESGANPGIPPANAQTLHQSIKQFEAAIAKAHEMRPLGEEIQTKLQGRFAKVDRVRAELAKAKYDLEQTVVSAPADGHVANLQLTSGAMASSGKPVMSFVETKRSWVVAVVAENGLELVKPGDKIEVAIAMYPGEVFSGEVESIVWGTGQAQSPPSGQLPEVTTTSRKQRFMVRLKIDDLRAEQPLRQGSTATAAIYTGHGKPLHVIRKVQVRIQSMLNYLYL